ncbi:hypothetical protein T484DRAFT_1749252 [Baffinella frigidus]|nr:hypothetical protein T484DRAFT_1749252 [Cryptophyta sp. CCMP2293]
MADDACDTSWYSCFIGDEPDEFPVNVPEGAASSASQEEREAPLADAAPPQNTRSSATSRIRMYREERPELMAKFMETICSCETGKPIADLTAFDGIFDGKPAQPQGGYYPAENGAAFIEVKGTTEAVAASVIKTDNVRKPPASPERRILKFPFANLQSEISETQRPGRSERHTTSARSAISTSLIFIIDES